MSDKPEDRVVEGGRPPTLPTRDRRPDYLRLAAGLLEARVRHVDFLDTAAGDEFFRLGEGHVARLYRRGRTRRPRADGPATPAGSRTGTRAGGGEPSPPARA